jgi:hypothetical protein
VVGPSAPDRGMDEGEVVVTFTSRGQRRYGCAAKMSIGPFCTLVRQGRALCPKATVL